MRLWLRYSAQLSVGALALCFVEGLRHGVPVVVVIIAPAAAALLAFHQFACTFFSVFKVCGAGAGVLVPWVEFGHAITQKKMTNENIRTAWSASIAVFMCCPVVVAPEEAGGLVDTDFYTVAGKR